MSAASAFIAQNPAASEGVDIDDVLAYAEHHAGGLFVLFRVRPDGTCVKMHDTWGDPTDPDEGPVVVHLYDADGDSLDGSDACHYYQTGAAALPLFLSDAEVGSWG